MRVAVAAGWVPGGDGAEAGHRWRGATAVGLLSGLPDERLRRMLVRFGVRPYPDTQAKTLPYPDTPAVLPQYSNTPADMLVITG